MAGRSGGRTLPVPDRRQGAVRLGCLVPALLALTLWLPGDVSAQDAELERGREVYDRWCASCHGFDGAGEGPAAGYMIPRPRDFTRGLYQIRTTAGGEIPTDDDIMRMINEGMPGTSMPGWRDQLSRRDREAVLAYIKSFYPPFETMAEPEPLDFGRAPRATDERIAEGRIFYDSIECWQCHGEVGRGEGSSSPELEDDWGNPIRAVDLTKNWKFNGGGSVEEIYQRLRTGLDGTPMPSFSDLLDAGFMTDDQMWNLAHFVRSLAPEREPRVREVIRADRVEPGEVPSTVEDERWDEVEEFYIPLVAQIVVMPRWFDPAVDGIRVQALHDGNELALRLSWSDRSRSPDPAWLQWQERILEAMEPKEGDPVEPEPRPDRFAVQFPREIPVGMDRPYFLMGSADSPVYLWRWQSDREGAEAASARGMHQIEDLGAAVASDAHWEDGQWRLLLRRELEPEDAANRLTFETGISIPIAFFAWDGDNGEDGTRGAVSSWFFIYLLEDPPPSTYVAPIVAFFLTGGLGLLVVVRAQRREREYDEAHGSTRGEGDDGPESGPEAEGGEDPDPEASKEADSS